MSTSYQRPQKKKKVQPIHKNTNFGNFKSQKQHFRLLNFRKLTIQIENFKCSINTDIAITIFFYPTLLLKISNKFNKKKNKKKSPAKDFLLEIAPNKRPHRILRNLKSSKNYIRPSMRFSLS